MMFLKKQAFVSPNCTQWTSCNRHGFYMLPRASDHATLRGGAGSQKSLQVGRILLVGIEIKKFSKLRKKWPSMSVKKENSGSRDKMLMWEGDHWWGPGLMGVRKGIKESMPESKAMHWYVCVVEEQRGTWLRGNSFINAVSSMKAPSVSLLASLSRQSHFKDHPLSTLDTPLGAFPLFPGVPASLKIIFMASFLDPYLSTEATHP